MDSPATITLRDSTAFGWRTLVERRALINWLKRNSSTLYISMVSTVVQYTQDKAVLMSVISRCLRTPRYS